MAGKLTSLSRRRIGMAALGAALGGGMVLAAQRVLQPVHGQGDVRAFGAKGDGVHDDRAALQQAIDQGGDALWFPVGQYRLGGPLRPRSGQVWRGAGPSRSVLVYGGDPTEMPFNLLHCDGSEALEEVTIRDLGFWGGRSRQVRFSPQGQEGFALYLRTALRAINILNCRFQHFGDGHSGGGGIILGPRPEAHGQGVENLRIEHCVFADNGNVPGLYIAASHAQGGPCQGISINDNSFAGSVGSTKVQNCIYILGGGGQSPIRHVAISGNRFEFDTRVDAAIELNWVDTFTLSGNTLHFQAAMPGSSGILIRDGCANGAIVGNVIVSDRADNDLRGILLLNFQHPGTISNLVISDNVVSGVIGAIGVDRGSTGVVVASNRISGSNAPASVGIRVVDASGVVVNGNMISAMAKAMTMGMGDRPASGLRNIVVERNRFDRCGDDGQALIAAIVPETGWTATDVLIRDNTAVGSVAGSRQIDSVFFTDAGDP